jgi:trans-2,3-dihydro-3-hydroxyanthranilate isomerase
MVSNRFYVANAFAEKEYGGNPAAIFIDPVGLDTGSMQAIARQLNLVETVFAFRQNSSTADFHLRFFTPQAEIPIAGHPTIATWSVLAQLGFIDIGKRSTYSQLTEKGVQQITFENCPRLVVRMQQPQPKFLDRAPDRDSVAAVFGIKAEEIAVNTPIECIDTGLGHIIFEVRTLDALMQVKRNIGALKELCTEFGVREAQLFTSETLDKQCQLHTRNICPREGLEDPACGVGNGALLAYLLRNQPGDQAELNLCIEQGHIVNMPSIIHASGKKLAADRMQILVGGSALIMINGEFICHPDN